MTGSTGRTLAFSLGCFRSGLLLSSDTRLCCWMETVQFVQRKGDSKCCEGSRGILHICCGWYDLSVSVDRFVVPNCKSVWSSSGFLKFCWSAHRPINCWCDAGVCPTSRATGGNIAIGCRCEPPAHSGVAATDIPRARAALSS